ncbi:MAG: YibE/F family protein [Kutzneria sp.]|nr:YibE/F family protein [Kutzneria sp.]
MTHGHGHHHGSATPASAKVRKLVVGLLLPLALGTLVAAAMVYPWHGRAAGGTPAAGTTVVHGVVTATTASDCGGGGAKQCVAVTVAVDNGHTVTEPMPLEPSTPRFSVDDKVVLGYNGGDPTDPGSYQLLDFQRGIPLAVLAVLFSIAVLVLGRWQGLKALGALLLTFVILILFVLPAILAGKDPLTVAVAGSALIMFVVLYLTHGLSVRTSTAVAGTLVSLTLIGMLGWIFAVVANLTGLDEDTANLITLLGHGVDSRGLLLAGVVIGSVGVLDDVTVTQTSAVWELRRANPSLGWRRLYAAGLRIGRDHMSSSVNTLVMAYAGAGLPLLLAYSVTGRGFADALTAETVAQEVLRTLVGSIGLIASVPITTLLAALVAHQETFDDPISADDYPTESLIL